MATPNAGCTLCVNRSVTLVKGRLTVVSVLMHIDS